MNPEQISLMRLILDNIEDGVALIDTAGKIVSFNPAAGRIIGRPFKEVLGKDWSEVLRFVDSHGLALTKEMQPVSRALVRAKKHQEKRMLIYIRCKKPEYPFMLLLRR